MADSGSTEAPIPLSELKQAALQSPGWPAGSWTSHRANHRLGERLKLTEEAVSLDEAMSASSLLPYEEVRDFFHFKDNYIDALDRAAEDLAQEIGLDGPASADMLLEMYLRERLGVRVRYAPLGDMMRRYDPSAHELWLNSAQPAATRAFQMAYHVAVANLSDIIEAELGQARFKSPEAVDVCRVGLGNYGAGALMTPYRRFAAAAREQRHDVEQLAAHFGASLEQPATGFRHCSGRASAGCRSTSCGWTTPATSPSGTALPASASRASAGHVPCGTCTMRWPHPTAFWCRWRPCRTATAICAWRARS